MFVPSKYFSTRMRPTLKPFARCFASSSVTSPVISIFDEVGRAEAALGGEPDVIDGARIDADDRAADRVERDLAVAHDDQAEVERHRREHAALAGGDRVDRDELRLDDVLEVGDLLVELVIVIDQAMPIVLDADVVLHRERHRRPRVRLELRAVDEEVGARDRLGREEVVAQPARVRERDLDLLLLLEVVVLDADVARASSSQPDSRNATRVGTVMPQRSPTASSVIASPPTSCSARSTPSPNSGRVYAYGNSGPAATRFGLTSVRPNGRRPSSSRPSRMIVPDLLRVVLAARPEDDLRLRRDPHDPSIAPRLRAYGRPAGCGAGRRGVRRGRPAASAAARSCWPAARGAGRSAAASAAAACWPRRRRPAAAWRCAWSSASTGSRLRRGSSCAIQLSTASRSSLTIA